MRGDSVTGYLRAATAGEPKKATKSGFAEGPKRTEKVTEVSRCCVALEYQTYKADKLLAGKSRTLTLTGAN
jgi:hypothetical protein